VGLSSNVAQAFSFLVRLNGPTIWGQYGP